MNRNREVYVIGAGGHAKVVISTLQAAGYTVKVAFDDDSAKWRDQLLGVPVMGATADFERVKGSRAIIAVGDNTARRALAERFQEADWITLVHPEAKVHPSVRLGPGTVVFAGVVIQPGTAMGAHSIVNTGATVDHDCRIASYVHLAPGTHLAGEVQLDEGVFLGIGSVVASGIKVGRWAIVGAGGVVVSDLPERVTAVGIPAKPVGERLRR